MSDDSIRRSPCNRCHSDTQHDVLHTEHHREDISVEGDEEICMTWYERWTLLRCRGCYAITAHNRCDFSEWGHDEFEEHYYPPRVARRLPDWQGDLPYEVFALMEEVYTALHAGSRRLAMMGSRAMLDLMIVEKVGDVGNFQQKLSKLEEEGFIASKNKELLNTALDAGNAASHRGFEPTVSVANQVMDIVENVLQAAYLESTADQVRKATPPRRQPRTESQD